MDDQKKLNVTPGWNIVFVENNKISLYNIYSQQKVTVNTLDTNHISYYPKIFGSRIVFSDNNNNVDNLYYCDIMLDGKDGGCLENDKKFFISNDSISESEPKLYNNTLFYPYQIVPYTISGF